MTDQQRDGAQTDDPTVASVRRAQGTTDADLGGEADGLPGEPPAPGEGGSEPPPPEATLPGR